jgi:hypothetical protein
MLLPVFGSTSPAKPSPPQRAAPLQNHGLLLGVPSPACTVTVQSRHRYRRHPSTPRTWTSHLWDGGLSRDQVELDHHGHQRISIRRLPPPSQLPFHQYHERLPQCRLRSPPFVDEGPTPLGCVGVARASCLGCSSPPDPTSWIGLSPVTSHECCAPASESAGDDGCCGGDGGATSRGERTRERKAHPLQEN